jgi:hypothetical protein
MGWIKDFPVLAEWAMQIQDLRHRFLYAESAAQLMTSPGIAYTYETMASLAIYEAALGKGYRDAITVECEKPYPGDTARNSRRADLAFKDPGPGKVWAYIEVKCLDYSGKRGINNDIEKLRSIGQRAQRWLYVYRVRSLDKKKPHLAETLAERFGIDLEVIDDRKFSTISGNDNSAAVCELCFARVKS